MFILSDVLNRRRDGEKMLITDIKWAKTYLIGTIVQMFAVCSVVAVLRASHIQYPEALNILFLIIGGGSSAIWGIIVSLKSKRIDSALRILTDFFDVRQPMARYGIVATFLAILFAPQLLSGLVVDGVKWYSFVILFLQSIIFGGIEELGWRYTFQPILEKRVPFVIAAVLTFMAWGLWHYMYFYLTDSMQYIQHISFLIGLLGSSFILGAIYKISGSLWLCVLYHCLLNVFSQTLLANSLSIVIVCNILCIVLSVVLIVVNKNNRLRMQSEFESSVKIQ